MNKDLLVNIIMVALGIGLFLLLWPVIKWLATIALVLFAGACIYVYFKSKKVKKEIEIDPIRYYSNVNNVHKDVIDVEYKEKEVVEKTFEETIER